MSFRKRHLDFRFRISLPITICFVIWAIFVTGCQFAKGPLERVNARKLRLARGAASLSTLGHARVRARPIHRNRRLSTLKRLVTSKPQPTETTQQYMRRFVLDRTYKSDPYSAIRLLNRQTEQHASLTQVHALVELAQIEADWQYRLGRTDYATRLYATAVLRSSRFLFDPQLDVYHNAYDPQFREVSDTYNHSLSQLIKVLMEKEQFGVGNEIEIQTIDETLSLVINLNGRWQNQSFDRFELACDYEVEGLINEYVSHGLGVPVIAVRQQQTEYNEQDQYYPPGLSIPMTALLHVANDEVKQSANPVNGAQKRSRIELDLIDPLQKTTVDINGRETPLETNLSTPMAYYLSDPLLDSNVFATLAMLNTDFANNFQGLYILEPYDPNKIPVVMVHGFWSSPITWLQMFNDLRAISEIRDKYQFWFLMYPTGQPFWVSAAQVREDLARVRQDLDPDRKAKALDEMVLVGHSMGGLVSKLQTLDSGDSFWKLVTNRPFSDIRGEPEILEKLKKIFFFEQNPSVKRVITIATPHQGSFVANNTTSWLSRKTFALPQMTAEEAERLVQNNLEIFAGTEFEKVRTSVDSLTPGAPFIEAVRQFDVPSTVKLHNIYGVEPDRGVFKRSKRDRGDGVVSVASATAVSASSELQVESQHTQVHQQPETILEVRRILLDHLVEVGRLGPDRRLVLPAGILDTQPLEIELPTRQVELPKNQFLPYEAKR